MTNNVIARELAQSIIRDLQVTLTARQFHVLQEWVDTIIAKTIHDSRKLHACLARVAGDRSTMEECKRIAGEIARQIEESKP